MKVVAFVPAKGSSDRVPSKNMRILDGEYLFKRKLRQLLACPLIDEVWLDTESQKIIDEADDLPVKVLKRDPALATNATDGHEMFENECLHVPDADIVIQALCTAPFVDERTVSAALEKLLSAPDNDSLVAVSESAQYTWQGSDPAYGRGRVPNSVDLPRTTVEAMSLYMVRKSAQGFPKKRYGMSPILHKLDARELIDINYKEDLDLAEMICRGERSMEANYFRVLKHHLSSSILSDVTKEMGHAFMLAPNLRPVSEGKMLGRVRTLKLGALQGDERDIHANEAWKGIYGALESYKFVRSGDIIVVENAVPDRAYFGDLNCHLAMRAGAAGVLVDGVTRDVADVAAMGLPVYARGAWSNDIKYEGTTLSYNKPITVGGVSASNDDVLFADAEGVLIVPAQAWPAVLEKALTVVSNERHIRQALLKGTPVEEIISSFGFF